MVAVSLKKKHPLLRFLGPVPASALLPLAFFFAPSSYSAAVFLIALATFFPVAVLTWSGVAGVSKSYYDVARTLGASPWFLVLRVAIPAALPQVFVGLFMGLGAAFSVLITAEMMGVKAGLGWAFLDWELGAAEGSDNQFVPQGSVFYKATDNLDFNLSAMFVSGEDEDDELGDTDADLARLALGVRYWFDTQSRFVPYLGAGIGYYIVDGSTDNTC